MKRNMMQEQRLRFIDFLLDHYGWFNRRLLCDYFALSTPQASLDMKAYMEAAPCNATYSLSAKRYERASGYARVFP